MEVKVIGEVDKVDRNLGVVLVAQAEAAEVGAGEAVDIET